MNAFRVAALLFLLILAAVPAKAQTITLGVSPGLDVLPLSVAVREGLFAAKGLTVVVRPFPSAKDLCAAASGGGNGQFDGFLGDMVNTLLLLGSGAPMKIVATASASTPGQRLFGLAATPRMKGATIKNIAHNSVGLAQSTFQAYLLGAMEASAGITAGNLRSINISNRLMRAQMLLNGEINTAILPEPLLTQAENKGCTVLATDENLGMPLSVLCLKSSLATKPAVLAPFLEAYAQALERLKAAPERYRPLMAEVCQIPPDLAGTFPIYAPPPPALPSQEQLLAVQQWMLKKGLLRTQLGYGAVTAGP